MHVFDTYISSRTTCNFILFLLINSTNYYVGNAEGKEPLINLQVNNSYFFSNS